VASSPASRHVDLLTVVMHELGHVLGFPSIDPATLGHDWMTATLGTGIRRLSDPAGLTFNASSHASAFASGAALANLDANDVSLHRLPVSGLLPANISDRSRAVALWAGAHHQPGLGESGPDDSLMGMALGGKRKTGL
jgi:hypothetical protein